MTQTFTNTDERDRVARKIRALADKTTNRGATEDEANQAMEKVGELLEAYNLSMDEVMIREEECIQKQLGEYKRRPSYDTAFVGIAHLTDTKLWKTWKGGFVFFGMRKDVEMAEYLFNIVVEAVQTETAKFKKTDAYKHSHHHGKTLTSSFQKGMGSRLYRRMVDIKDEIEDERERAEAAHAQEMANRGVSASDQAQAEAARQKTGTELISIKHDYVEEEFEKLGMRLRKSYNKSYVRAGNAYNQGIDAGGRVNLSRPVNGSGNNKVAGYLS